MVMGPSRLSLTRIENCVVRRPAAAVMVVVKLRDVTRRLADGEAVALLRPGQLISRHGERPSLTLGVCTHN